jgi:AP-2 complex subunit mu-1
VGWRKDSIKYKKNEIYLDIVEEVNLMMSSKGQILRSDVNGKIVMKVFLSGMPDVKLGLNEKLEVNSGPVRPFPTSNHAAGGIC